MKRNPSLPPTLDRDSLTEIERGFLAQYGETLASWARLEQTLCRLFCALCKFRAGSKLGPALFFSARSFNARADLLSAAIRSSRFKEIEMSLLRAILKKCRQYSSARNAIAHGYPTHMVFADLDYEGWRIKEGDVGHEPGGIGIDQLKSAAFNFMQLEGLVGGAPGLLKPRPGYDLTRLWQERLEQVQMLPSNAFLPSEGQSATERPPRGVG